MPGPRRRAATRRRSRSASPAKNLKICPGPHDFADRLGAASCLLRARSRSPSSSAARQDSLPTASSASKRCCGVEAAQRGWAAWAAAIASAACWASARAYSPTTSRVSEGLMLSAAVRPDPLHSPGDAVALHVGVEGWRAWRRLSLNRSAPASSKPSATLPYFRGARWRVVRRQVPPRAGHRSPPPCRPPGRCR